MTIAHPPHLSLYSICRSQKPAIGREHQPPAHTAMPYQYLKYIPVIY